MSRLSSPSARARQACGSIDNFEAANDTMIAGHGSETAMADIDSSGIARAFSGHHHGSPGMKDPHTDLAHQKFSVPRLITGTANGSMLFIKAARGRRQPPAEEQATYQKLRDAGMNEREWKIREACASNADSHHLGFSRILGSIAVGCDEAVTKLALVN